MKVLMNKYQPNENFKLALDGLKSYERIRKA